MQVVLISNTYEYCVSPRLSLSSLNLSFLYKYNSDNTLSENIAQSKVFIISDRFVNVFSLMKCIHSHKKVAFHLTSAVLDNIHKSRPIHVQSSEGIAVESV